MNTLDGRVISMCQPRHRHTEWLKFLRLIDRKTPKELTQHLVVDNHAKDIRAKVARANAALAIASG